MPANLIRVIEGPFYGPNDSLIVPPHHWGVMRIRKLPDDNAPDAALEHGEVLGIYSSEQEAEKQARAILFPELPRKKLDPLDALPTDGTEEDDDLDETIEDIDGDEVLAKFMTCDKFWKKNQAIIQPEDE